MIWALLAPLAAGALLGGLGPRLARATSPGLVARVVPATCVLVAASTGLSLSVFAVLVTARARPLAGLGHLSTAALPWPYPQIPAQVGVAVAVVVVVLLGASLAASASTGRELAAAQQACRELGHRPDGVHVLADSRPRAVAVLGLPGRVVLSTGMVALLSAGELDAVVAHERAHLRRRHHLGVVAMRLAAIADPLLRPMVAVTEHAVEREADEDAALVVGDRRTVARAVIRASLAGAGSPRPGGPEDRSALAATAGDAPRRVEALLEPARPPRRAALIPLLALALVAGGAGISNAVATDRHLDAARSAWMATAPVQTAPGRTAPRQATPGEIDD